jgi:hypothetical protein
MSGSAISDAVPMAYPVDHKIHSSELASLDVPPTPHKMLEFRDAISGLKYRETRRRDLFPFIFHRNLCFEARLLPFHDCISCFSRDGASGVNDSAFSSLPC